MSGKKVAYSSDIVQSEVEASGKSQQRRKEEIGLNSRQK